MNNLNQILARMNMDNIWSNSYDDITAMQRALGVKDDGIIGKNTIIALQRKLKVKDDGRWGSKSISAAKNFRELPAVPAVPVSQETDGWSLNRSNTQSDQSDQSDQSSQLSESGSNFWDGSWAFGKQIARVSMDSNVPDEYMSQTRSGDATPEQIAQERLKTVSDYVTNDIGGNVNYKLGTHVPRQEREEIIHEGNDDALIRSFNKDYAASTGDSSKKINYPIYPKGWGATGYFIDSNTENPAFGNRHLITPSESGQPTLWYAPRTNYEIELERYLATTPAETKVETVTKSAGATPQSQLSDLDRKQWTKDINTEVLQIAELYSQLEDAKTRMANGYTPEQREQAEKDYKALAHQIAMTSNAETFSLNGENVDSFPQDYRAAIDAGLKSWTPETRKALQEMYSKYRMSPYWNHMPWGERYTLDHLYGAGYSYDDVSSGKVQTAGQVGQKLSDAIDGTFTPRTLNGGDNGWFTLVGDRQGVHRHLAQRGDNITNWQFNTAPMDAQGIKMNKPYFQIGAQQAWDWKEGVPRIPLSTTMNFKYDKHQRNLPVMGNMNIMNSSYLDQDFSNFDDWSEEDQQKVAGWLSNNGFNVTDTSLFGYKDMISSGGKQSYDPEAVKKTMNAIKNAKKALSNPSAGQASGKNSFYHFPMQQTNQYTSNIFGNSISGIQMMDGKPYSFNQDNYDISIPGFEMFGNSAWYRNINEIPQSQWQTIRRMAGN